MAGYKETFLNLKRAERWSGTASAHFLRKYLVACLCISQQNLHHMCRRYMQHALCFFGGGGWCISWESFIRRQLGNGGESIPRNLVFPGVSLSVCEPTQDPREAIFLLRSWKKQQWEKLNNGLWSLPMYSVTAAASLWWCNYTPRVAGIPQTEAPCILACNWSFPNSTNKQFCFVEAERSGSQMECHLI